MPLQEPRDNGREAPPGAFLLRPSPAALRRGFVRLFAEPPGAPARLCIVPALPGVPLHVAPRASARVRLADDEGDVAPAALAARLRGWLPRYAKPALRFGAVAVRPDGGDARAFRRLVKFARAAGVAFDGETLRRRPELALGWPDEPGPAPAPGPARIAVALHLHYAELWPEIATLLGRWRRPFALLVSLTRDDAQARRAILARFPAAEIEIVANAGRDVRPFLAWLEAGRFDPFDLVCKIHGKRSLRPGAPPLYGDLFRRAAFLDLIGDEAQVAAICGRFAADPRLGLIGPERFRAKSRHGDPTEIMGASRAEIERLAGRLQAPIGADYDVFHGTMFWARPAALTALRALRLADGFVPEAGRSDGALEHAVEGLVNHAVRAAGFAVAGTAAP